MIYVVAPKSGRTNPLVYISICSSVGSISVMAVKASSIAVKLTVGGENQFSRPSTYAFLIILVVSTLTQMNYLNKAIDEFPASLFVSPIQFQHTVFTSILTDPVSMLCTMLYSQPVLFPHLSFSTAASTQQKLSPHSLSSAGSFSTSSA
jgi:hypothetical protein